MNAAAASPSGARPVDWLLGGYNAIAAGIWIAAIGRSPAAPWIVAAHALGALLPWGVAISDRGTSRFLRAAREAYPLLLLYPLYAEVGLFHAAMGSAGHDATVAAWDRAVFSKNWHRAWASAMPAAWLREAMHASYFSYYLLIALPPIAASIARRWGAFRAISFRMMLTYVVCYAIYFAYPAFGPMHADPQSAAGAAGGFFPGLVRAAAASGDSPGTAFPSSHVAGALTAAWLGFRWHARWVAWAQLALALGVALSTVYTGNHYAIDALVGILLAVVLQVVVAPRFEGRGDAGPR